MIMTWEFISMSRVLDLELPTLYATLQPWRSQLAYRIDPQISFASYLFVLHFTPTLVDWKLCEI